MSSPVYGDSPAILAIKVEAKADREREFAERYESRKRRPRRIPRSERKVGSTGIISTYSSSESEPELTPEAEQAEAQFRKLPLAQQCKDLRKGRPLLESLVKNLSANYLEFKNDIPKCSVKQNQARLAELDEEKDLLESRVGTWSRRVNAIYDYRNQMEAGTNQDSVTKWLDILGRLQMAEAEFSRSCAKIAFDEQKHPGLSEHQFAVQQAQKYVEDLESNEAKQTLVPLITPKKMTGWQKLAQNTDSDYQSNLEEMKELEDVYAAYHFNSKLYFEAQVTELSAKAEPKDSALLEADYLCRDLDILTRLSPESERREQWQDMLEKIEGQRRRLVGCVWVSTVRFYTAAYEYGYRFDSLPELSLAEDEASGDERSSSSASSDLVMQDVGLTSATRGAASAALSAGKARTSKFVESGLDAATGDGSEGAGQGSSNQQRSQPASTQSQTTREPGQGGEQQLLRSPRRKDASRDLRKQANAGASRTDSSKFGVATAVRTGRGKLVDTASRGAHGSSEHIAGRSSSSPEPGGNGDWAADDDMPAIMAMIEAQELEERKKKTHGSG